MSAVWLKAIVAAAFLTALPAHAQDRHDADRNDPAVIERDQEQLEPQANPRQRQGARLRAPDEGRAAASASNVVPGAIRVSGASRVPVAAFAPAIEPYLGRTAEHADLVRLATDVANVMRRSGYGLATAWVPAQDLVGGILLVEVDEGRIDAVRARGPGATLVEQRLHGIVAGGPVRTDELERQLLLIGDMAGLWVGEARLVREGGRNILTVTTRYQRVQGLVRVDNWGTGSVGPVRAWAELDLNGLLRQGDGLAIEAAVTPLEPAEFQFIEARYQLPVGPAGTIVAVGGYLGYTRSSGTNSELVGNSSGLQLTLAQPLSRSRESSLWLSGQLSLRDGALDRNGIPVRDDRIVSATASLFGTGRFAGGRVRGRVSLVQGLDVLDTTQNNDPLASRADAGGVFTKLEAWAEYRRLLGGGFSIELASRSQVSDGPLLASEEMGLGGPQFLRAFDYRERSGDEGVAASSELRYDIRNITQYIDRMQLYSYGDIGRVYNHGASGRSGTLASAGAGARVGLRNGWEAGVELGIPLTDGNDDPDPHPRFSFSLTARF